MFSIMDVGGDVCLCVRLASVRSTAMATCLFVCQVSKCEKYGYGYMFVCVSG